MKFETRESLYEYIKTNPLAYRSTIRGHAHQELYAMLKSLYPEHQIKTTAEKIWLYCHYYDAPKKCECGVNLRFINIVQGYPDRCKACTVEYRTYHSRESQKKRERAARPTLSSDEIRGKILKLVEEKPKHFSAMTKRDPELDTWVKTNSLVTSDTYLEHIYSAVYQTGSICEHGNAKRVLRFADGWVGCTASHLCECAKRQASVAMVKTKSGWSPEKHAEVNGRRAQTMVDTYGSAFNFQRASVKEKISMPKVSAEVYALLSNHEWLNMEYNVKQRTLSDIGDSLGVDYGTVGDYCRKLGFKIRQVSRYSRDEVKISDYLTSIGVDHIRNDWDTLNNKELDILIPHAGLAIEVNGIYWHSYVPTNPKEENPTRHLSKTLEARGKGIRILHFTDQEIRERWPLVTATIERALGKTDTIPAEACTIVSPTADQQGEFLAAHSWCCHSASAHAVGLCHDGQLVQLMAFTQTQEQVEISHLCTLSGLTITNGSATLLGHANEFIGDRTITASSDMGKSTGSEFADFGLTQTGEPVIESVWTDNNQILPPNPVEWLSDYEPTRSEEENMFAAGYRRYWADGRQTWVMHPCS